MNHLQGIGVLVILASFSAILYRLGGAEGFDKLFRRLGCSIIFTTYMLYLGYSSQLILCIPYILSFILLYLALSTYWDRIFGYDNMFAHGIGVGLALLPFAWFGIVWWLILIRALILGIAYWFLNKYPAKWGWKHTDLIEELSRGFLIIATLPIITLVNIFH